MLFFGKKQKPQTQDNLPLAVLDSNQINQLNIFKESHKTTCNMSTYQITINHRDGSGDRVFLICSVCGRGCEVIANSTNTTT